MENNRGNGLSVKGSFFEASRCRFRNNQKTGLEYNPSLTAYETLEIRTRAHKYIDFNQSMSYALKDYEVQWFLTKPESSRESIVYDLEISVSSTFKVSQPLSVIIQYLEAHFLFYKS